jgi:di/tricarboxylate transporter
MDIGSQALITLLVVGAIGVTLALTRLPADAVLVAAVTLLLTLGIISPSEALAGLSNEGMVTVAVLFIVAAALRETGGLAILTERALGRPQSVPAAQLRLMAPVTVMSAFLNNTPLVAMMIPVVIDWARRCRISASRLLLPLSYATILGGTCSLIGTSTNLVVYGLLLRGDTPTRLGLFDISWVGVPCAVVGLAYILLANRWLLPARKPAATLFENPREYTVEMLVPPGSPLDGRSIEDAGLRHLPGSYLMEIHRAGEVLPAVASSQRLRAGDRLVFAGVVESVVDLQRIRGLAPATEQIFKLNGTRADRRLIEAVVSGTCPLVGRTIRDGQFRSVYNAAVIAVARNGERIHGRIGDIVLRPGDTLLLEAHPSFAEQHRNTRDFFLTSTVKDSAPPRHDRAPLALAILAGMLAAAGTGVLTMLNAAMVAAGLLLLTRCISVWGARRSVDGSVLVVIAAAFGISRAMEVTGAATWVATGLLGLAGTGPWVALATVYGLTMVFTAFMTNNAAAVLMYPIVIATARGLGVSVMPFVIALMMASSNDFATPIGYQTNLMVQGPGGYRFADYVRFGGPLNLLMMATAVLLIPLVWPFR